MAVFISFGPTGFWLGFVVSECIVHVSSINWEGLLMFRRALCEITAYAICNVRRAITSWEGHPPPRLSLLMSS